MEFSSSLQKQAGAAKAAVALNANGSALVQPACSTSQAILEKRRKHVGPNLVSMCRQRMRRIQQRGSRRVRAVHAQNCRAPSPVLGHGAPDLLRTHDELPLGTTAGHNPPPCRRCFSRRSRCTLCGARVASSLTPRCGLGGWKKRRCVVRPVATSRPAFAVGLHLVRHTLLTISAPLHPCCTAGQLLPRLVSRCSRAAADRGPCCLWWLGM